MKTGMLCCQYCALRRKSVCVYILASCMLFTTVVLFTKTVSQFRISSLKQTHRLDSFLSHVTQTSTDVKRDSSDVTQCRSVFPGMLHGRWVPKKNISEARKREMEEYLHQTRGEYRIPRSLQRADGKCGNLPYKDVPLYKFMWFRAICNPEGPTPCCFNFHCSNRSVDDCRCPFCLDSRTPVHAELSDWLPAQPMCQPREFYANEACELLKGTTVVLAGDSFMRHMFVALVMLLTGNFQSGALRKDAPLGIRSICQGMYQINGLRCRDILDQNRTLCKGKVQVTYLEIFQVKKGKFLLPYLKMQSSRNHNVLLLLGVGIHDDFRVDLMWPMFLQPLVAYVTTSSNPPANSTYSFANTTNSSTNSLLSHNHASLYQPNGFTWLTKNAASLTKSSLFSHRRKWPKLIWVNTHAPGLLKSPLFPIQSFQGVRYYNEVMARLLEPYGIPVLDTFNMTAPLHSVDGTHYGYGANNLKVQFLLNWVQERQDRQEW